MADSVQIRETIDRYCAAFSANDRDGWLACFDESATLEDPVGSPVRKGYGELGEFFDQMQAMAAPISLNLDGPAIVCGTEASFRLRIETTMGDTKFGLYAIDVMTFGDDTRITSQRAFVDLTTAQPV